MILKVYKKGNEKEPFAIYGGNFSFDISSDILFVRTLGTEGADEYYGVVGFDASVNANIIHVTVEE